MWGFRFQGGPHEIPAAENPACASYNLRMTFLEPLPPQCPPSGAAEIDAPRIVFRLVKSTPPTLDDFRSQRALSPLAAFQVTECLARGLSVHTEREHSLKAAKLPRLRGSVPCAVRLDAGAGYIQPTAAWSHHTWWPFAAFDIVAHCVVAKP